MDDDVKSLVLEISGTNVATTYITCPIKPRASLGIKLPFLVMVIKNMKKYFTFEIQILGKYSLRRSVRSLFLLNIIYRLKFSYFMFSCCTITRKTKLI